MDLLEFNHNVRKYFLQQGFKEIQTFPAIINTPLQNPNIFYSILDTDKTNTNEVLFQRINEQNNILLDSLDNHSYNEDHITGIIRSIDTSPVEFLREFIESMLNKNFFWKQGKPIWNIEFFPQTYMVGKYPLMEGKLVM